MEQHDAIETDANATAKQARRMMVLVMSQTTKAIAFINMSEVSKTFTHSKREKPYVKRIIYKVL